MQVVHSFFADLNEAVERLITISQLDTVLTITGTVADAEKMIS